MRRILYIAEVRTPDGSDTSIHGDGCEPGHGQTLTSGWVSPDRSMVLTYENPDEVAPDVFAPDEDDEDEDKNPAAWLAKTLGHWDRLYEVETAGVKFDEDGTIFYSSYTHEVPGTWNEYGDPQVTLSAHVEGFTQAEIEEAIVILKRR